MKFREYNQEQPWLIPPNIEDEIPKDDICRVINDVIDQIDISKIEDKYKEEGNPAYHPRMMLKALFYSYSQSVFSSRGIAKELERNIFFWFISGKQRPDFRTINLFRNRHKKELHYIFDEIVRLCLKLGVAKISTVVIDGTKIKANANKDKFRDKKWLESKIESESDNFNRAIDEAERIDREEDDKYGKNKRGDEIPEGLSDPEKRIKKLKKLKKELDKENLNRINETDHECRIMKSKSNYMPAYNCQAIVDLDSQVIITADVVNNENDRGQIKEQCDSLIKTHKQNPKVVIGDTGYSDGNSFQYLKNKGIEGIIPDKQISDIKSEIENNIPEDKKFKKDQFRYDKRKDIYVCPEGKELKKVSPKPSIANRKNGKDVKFHQYKCIGCNNCLYKPRCCKGKNNRCVTRYEDEELRENMAAKIRSKRGYELYKLRMKTVEPVFGHIKHNLGFRYFSMRGLKAVRGEFYILASVYNLLKIKNHLKKRVFTEIISIKNLFFYLLKKYQQISKNNFKHSVIHIL